VFKSTLNPSGSSVLLLLQYRKNSMSCAGLAPLEGRDPFKWRIFLAPFHCLYALVLSPPFFFPFFIPHYHHQSSLLLCVQQSISNSSQIIQSSFAPQRPIFSRTSKHYFLLFKLLGNRLSVAFHRRNQFLHHPSTTFFIVSIILRSITPTHSKQFKSSENNSTMDSTNTTRCKLQLKSPYMYHYLTLSSLLASQRNNHQCLLSCERNARQYLELYQPSSQEKTLVQGQLAVPI
jgi:hypothetical protein